MDARFWAGLGFIGALSAVTLAATLYPQHTAIVVALLALLGLAIATIGALAAPIRRR